MNIFKKDDFVDLTYLKKRGLIKIEEEKEEVIDFTKNEPIQTAREEMTGVQQSSTGPLCFFDNIPSANKNTATNESFLDKKTDDLASDFHALKIKVEDIEYKLERMIEKLNKIEDNLFNIQRKFG